MVKSHGDDLSLEYLWNGDEYCSAMEKNAEYGGQPKILALVHVIQRPITVHYEDSDKGTVFGIDFLYYPEERGDKGELIKAGHYVLLRRATMLLKMKMKRFILWVTMLLFAQKQMIGSCVISEINDPSKEVKFRFMRKSWQYFLLSKKLEKWFPKSAILYRCSILSIDNRICYSFDAIDVKGICDNIKTYTR